MDENTPELAQRCNAIALRQSATSMGLDGMDPPALTRVRDELVARGGAAIPEVLESLPHSLLLRRIASSVLARQPSDRSRAAMVELLVDPDERVAASAADGLGRVGGVEVVEPLLAAASRKPNAVRHNALNALVAIGAADRAVDVALHALEVADGPSRASAAELLTALRGRAHLERAAAALDRRIALEELRDVHAIAVRSRRVIAARLGD